MYKRFIPICFVLIVCSVARAAPPNAHAIATAHPLATEAGVEILRAGGNAFDASVAISAALAVVEPMGFGLGGGGFWLLHRASDGHQTLVDGREVAPLAATRDMYLDAAGNVIPERSLDGPLAAAIPGAVAGLAHIAKNYGRLPLAQTLAPAIKLARDGFVTDKLYARASESRAPVLNRWSGSAVFLNQGKPPEPGFLLKQPDLANTLEAIAKTGPAAFYTGEIAKKLVDGVRAAGGIWTLDDLARYQVKERAPIRFEYRGARITSAPPPSSGGIAIATMLNILSGYDLAKLPEPLGKHLTVEAMRRAYRDRAEYLGDPDFVKIPVERLLSAEHAAEQRSSIRDNLATKSASLPVAREVKQGTQTTHFSVFDADGNRVAATLTLNFAFGSGFVAPGTGVLLNDEMDDFSAKPGNPNAYGLIGGEANAIAPGKRPLSSMSPTFVETERGLAVLGTPGGSRIITRVLLSIFDYLHGKDAHGIVRQPHFHHQFLPDKIVYEDGALSFEDFLELEKRGHLLEEVTPYGDMQAVVWEKDGPRITAASDPRGHGTAIVLPRN